MFDMEALARALFFADWPLDTEEKWKRHVEQRDVAYRRYVKLAETAFTFIKG